jgi:hypothetical protein
LSELIDVGGRHVIWIADPAAIITGYQHLNGKLLRVGQRIIGGHHGTSDYAATYSVRGGNVDLESSSEVLGISSPSELATYTDLDAVTFYADMTAPPALFGAASATYESGRVILSPGLSADDVKRLRIGMIVKTRHVPAWSGIITNFESNGSSISVSGWYLIGGGGTASTPTNGTGIDVNPFTKVWAHNANVGLASDSFANAACGFELGVINNKASPGGVGNHPLVWGMDVVNLGLYPAECAFIARGNGNGFYYGSKAQDCDVGFYQAGPGTGLKNFGNGHVIDSYHDTGAGNFNINTKGCIEAGRKDEAWPVYIDFHSSGAAEDYSSRLVATGGTSTLGQGTLSVNALSFQTQTLLPGTANAYPCGTSTNPWSVIYSGTGVIITSDERQKRDIAGLDIADARALLALIDAKTFKYIDVDSPASVQTSTRQRQKTVMIKRETVTEELTVVDGAAVLAKIQGTEYVSELVWDEYPVVDVDGNPVMEIVAKGGARPRIYRVPVMESYEDIVNLSPAYAKSNVRTHYGFIAQDVEAALAGVGKTTTDFAGLIIDQDSGILGLRYEQVLTILWPVVKDLVSRVGALEGG